MYIHSIAHHARSLMDLDCIVVGPVAKVVIVAFETKQSIFDHSLKTIWEKILFQLIEAYAEFEKNMIRERGVK